MVARATRHKKVSLKRRKARSSQECNASGLQPRSTLERQNARSSEELENIHLARSSEEKLARAKKHNSQVLSPDADSRSSDQTLARAKNKNNSSLERPTPRSSEGPKIWTATLGFQPNQPVTNLPNSTHNSKSKN